jgi:hypothetical protein
LPQRDSSLLLQRNRSSSDRLAVNCCVCPPESVAVAGVTLIDAEGINITVTEADSVASS